MQDELSVVRPDARCAVARMAFAAAVSTAFAAQPRGRGIYVRGDSNDAAQSHTPKQAALQWFQGSGAVAGTAED